MHPGFLRTNTAIRAWIELLLRGKNAVNGKLSLGITAIAKIVTQACAYLGRQWIIIGLGQIGHLQQGWIRQSARAASHHYRDLVATAVMHQFGFETYAIDGVDHIVILLVDVGGDIRSGQKIIDGVDPGIRIDRKDTFSHRLDLGLTISGLRGMDLSIAIGDANVVMVYQSDLTDTGPGQRLYGPGAYPTNANDTKVSLLNPSKGLRAIETLDT